jgi:hypothetical protein
MPVLYEKPALNLRSELASLKNQGGYSEQQFWFENLVTNGTFDSDLTGWTQTGNDASNYWEWASNAARCVSAGTFVPLTQAMMTKAQRYVLTLDVTVTSGGLKIGSTSAGIYNDIAANISSSGTYTYTFTALSNTLYFGRVSGVTDVSIDNVSVFEVDANDDVVHTMPKGWVPKDVFEDGLLQREGAAHDYEVVYDGFDYYVKPTVAPSATTQTCVIGVRA